MCERKEETVYVLTSVQGSPESSNDIDWEYN